MYKYLIVLLSLCSYLSSDEYVIYKEDYTVIPLAKQAKEIKVSNKDLLYVEYNKHVNEPFTELMLYGKEYGRVNLFVTYKDKSKESLWINIHRNLDRIKSAIKPINDTISLEEYKDDKFMLQGVFKTQKEKEKIIKILKNMNIDVEKNILDFSSIAKTPALSKIKMYMVEINNNKIDEFKSGINFYKFTDETKEETEISLISILDRTLTLSGALSAATAKFGSDFNLIHTLNFLQNKQLANILDETTLTVMEGETTEFHAGGTIYIKVQGITEEGQPTVELIEKNYGIILNITLHEVDMQKNTMTLSLDTGSTSIDWSNTVDGIPSFGSKSIKTKISSKNKKAIILSGLINHEDSKIITKIPLLGDIPIVGKLFRSETFKKGESELMFILIPELEEI